MGMDANGEKVICLNIKIFNPKNTFNTFTTFVFCMNKMCLFLDVPSGLCVIAHFDFSLGTGKEEPEEEELPVF